MISFSIYHGELYSQEVHYLLQHCFTVHTVYQLGSSDVLLPLTSAEMDH